MHQRVQARHQDTALARIDSAQRFAPDLSPVADLVIASPIIDDIHRLYRNALMRWDNHWMALTDRWRMKVP